MSPLLSLENVSFSRKRLSVLKNINLHVNQGEMVGLLGPNGCGKTTALRILVGLLLAEKGKALAGGAAISRLSPRERAQRVGYLPQSRSIAWRISVEDAVGLGRFAYGAPTGRLKGADREAVDQAMDRCGLTSLRERPVTDLSGGELSRVHVARALAGGAPALVADEPVTSLDPYHQLMVMDVLTQLAEGGEGLLVVLHDIVLAARYCTRLILMRNGEIFADGPSRDVLTSANLKAIFDIETAIRWDAAGPTLATIGLTKP